MKQFLLIFMVIGLVTAISATRPKYSSDGNIKPSGVREQQADYPPQTDFKLWIVNHSDPKFDIVLTNTATGVPQSFTVNGSSIHYVYDFTVGTYDIKVTPKSIPQNTIFFTVKAGCSQLVDVLDSSIALQNITLNSSCNSIVTDFQ